MAKSRPHIILSAAVSIDGKIATYSGESNLSYKINLKKLLNVLQKRGISKILLEGGGITNWYFLKEKLVDELILTVTPYILGGKDAISLVQGDGFGKISKSPSFKLKKIKRMKNE